MKIDAASFAAPSLITPGQSEAPATGDFRAIFNTAVTQPQTPQEELSAYLKKPLGEKIRDAILKELGLTEADLAAMPPEKRMAMEEVITARIKEKMLQQQESAMKQGQALLAMVAFATDAQKTMLDKAGPVEQSRVQL